MNLKSKKRALTLSLSGIAVLGAVGYGAWWYTSARFLQSTDDAYVGGDISAISAKVWGLCPGDCHKRQHASEER